MQLLHQSLNFYETYIQVFPDAFTKRELKSIRLHCPSEQCEWFGSYEELEVSWIEKLIKKVWHFYLLRFFFVRVILKFVSMRSSTVYTSNVTFSYLALSLMNIWRINVNIAM